MNELIAVLALGPRRQLPFPLYILCFLAIAGVCYFVVKRRESKLALEKGSKSTSGIVPWAVFLSSIVFLGLGIIAYFLLPERDEKFDDREHKHRLLRLAAWTLTGVGAASVLSCATAWAFQTCAAKAVVTVAVGLSVLLIGTYLVYWPTWGAETRKRAEEENRLQWKNAGEDPRWNPAWAGVKKESKFQEQVLGALTGAVCGLLALAAAAIAASLHVKRGGGVALELKATWATRIFLVWLVFILFGFFCWCYIEFPSGISYNT